MYSVFTICITNKMTPYVGSFSVEPNMLLETQHVLLQMYHKLVGRLPKHNYKKHSNTPVEVQ